MKGHRDSGAKPLRLHQSLAKKLAVKILSGKLKPGASLASEIEESAALGVSRTAYREAMRILTAKGLVESRTKTGSRVTPRARWNVLDPDVLGWMFSGRPDEHFVRDLFELRTLIEPAAASLAATRRSEDQLQRMRQSIEGMRRFGLANPKGRDADQSFHHAILEATGNEAIISLASSVGAAVTWTTQFKQRMTKSPRDALPDHEQVFFAIQDGSPARAHAAMTALIDAAHQDMKLAELPRSRDLNN